MITNLNPDNFQNIVMLSFDCSEDLEKLIIQYQDDYELLNVSVSDRQRNYKSYTVIFIRKSD